MSDVYCDDCGRDLNIEPTTDCDIDSVKVVCSKCGTTKDVSMVALKQEQRQSNV